MMEYIIIGGTSLIIMQFLIALIAFSTIDLIIDYGVRKQPLKEVVKDNLFRWIISSIMLTALFQLI